MEPYYVYILQSQKNQQFYIGSSNDPDNRLAGHNRGNTKSTSRYRPWKLVFTQKYDSKAKAIHIEKKLKRLKRKDYLHKIIFEGRIKIE
jgi:putative endonuclease